MNPFKWISTRLNTISTALKEINTEKPDNRINSIQSSIDLVKFAVQGVFDQNKEVIRLKSENLLLEAEIGILRRENRELWEMKEIIQEAVK